MKKLQFWALAAMVCMLAASCDNLSSDEKKIVGKYYVAESEETEATEEEPAMTVSIEGTQEYRKDKTLSMDFVVKLLVEIEDEYEDYFNVITVEYRQCAEGTWEVTGKTLTERCDPRTVKFDFIKSSAIDNDEASKYVIKGIKQYADAYMAKIKKDLSNASYTITLQTDREMVLEDEDGEEITCMRI